VFLYNLTSFNALTRDSFGCGDDMVVPLIETETLFFLTSLYSHYLQHKVHKVLHLLSQFTTITEFTTT